MYKQFDWQKTKIYGKLKKTNNYLFIKGISKRPKKVIVYLDDKRKIFIKNPYNVNYMYFFECDYYSIGDYYKSLLL